MLGQAVTRSRLRPDQVTAWAWAALAAAEVEPAVFVRPTARLVLAQLAAGYRGCPAVRSMSRRAAAGRPESPAPHGAPAAEQRAAELGHGTAAGLSAAEPITHSITSDQTSDTSHRATRPEQCRTAGRPTARQVRIPNGHRAEDGWPTDWAGLPFFLTTADQAGVPDALLADEVLAGRPLSWTVYQLGRRLVPGIDPADPALFALAGLVPAPLPLDPPTPAEAGCLAGHAERWAAVTAARLAEHRSGPAAVDPVRRRPGPRRASAALVFAEPGWIEIHLSLEGVRLDVRRAGLDVDPGWLRWLTAVVSFVYE